jgi:hypothetical protein
MKKHLLITLIALVTFTACKKEKTITTVSPGLYGTWELRSIVGGWGHKEIIAPGKGEQYQFNTGDTYLKIKDAKIEKQGAFKITYDGESNGFKYGLITLTNPDYTDAFSIKADTIYIGSSAADGPSYLYIKIK